MKPSTVAASLVIASNILSSLASASVTIDWVTVGNAGNAADPLTGYGAVGYEYKIGKYEVTNAQYVEFLNAAAKTDRYRLYPSGGLGITREGISGSYTYSVTGALANRPVVWVSWFNAARFANWLANGQGNGDTETGSYTLNGATDGIFLANAGAQVYIPSENEWHKAAYYNAVSQTYSLYPNGQNSITQADANYNYPSGDTTDVGSYINDASYYGTFDQGGNVFEWNDGITPSALFGPWEMRGRRGGSYSSTHDGMAATYLSFAEPRFQDYDLGFRLASAVPEPTSMIISMFAGGMMLIRRRR